MQDITLTFHGAMFCFGMGAAILGLWRLRGTTANATSNPTLRRFQEVTIWASIASTYMDLGSVNIIEAIVYWVMLQLDGDCIPRGVLDVKPAD